MKSAAYAVLLAIVAVLAGPVPTRSQAPEVIRVGTGTSDQVSALLYADHAGLFKAAGLTLQITKMKGGAEIAAAVTGGSLDIGLANVVSLITAHARGIPFTMIAPSTLYRADYHPDEALLVRSDSPFRSARDLVGKTISVVSLQDIFTLSLLVWLDKNGVDPQSVKFVELPPSSAAAALAQSRIDAAIVFQPFMQDAVQSGGARIFAYPLSAIGKQLEVSSWFGTTDWVTAHRDAVVRFEHAIYDASLYIGKHEDESAPLLAAFAGVDTETVLRVPRPSRALYIRTSELQPFIDAAAKYKFIPKPFPADELISPYALKAPR